MDIQFNDLQLRQLDDALARVRACDVPARPSAGWARAIREALGMAASHLAARLGVTTSTVTRLEASEAADTITLAALRRLAAALGCELHYALVPTQSLSATLEARALAVARERMAAVTHSMVLEAQGTSMNAVELQTRALADELLRGSRLALWREAPKTGMGSRS